MSIQKFESELNLEKNVSPNTGTLRFSGDLTIQDAIPIKNTLLDALSKVDICKLDLELVNIFDLSSIQILYAACKSAQERKKTLKLAGKCPNVFRNAVLGAGFDKVEWLGFGKHGGISW